MNIASQKELISVFGAPTEENAEDFFVASEFLGYGGRLAVVRAATGVNSASVAGGAVLVKNDEDWEAGNGTGNMFVARTAGTHANGLKIVAVDRGADQLATLTAAPAGLAAGDTVTFTGGKKAVVYSWDAGTLTAALILDDPTSRLTPLIASTHLTLVLSLVQLAPLVLSTSRNCVATLVDLVRADR